MDIKLIKTYSVIYIEFPTHAPITKNKTKVDKYIKINGQSLYNGSLQYYQRDIAVNWLHAYLCNHTKDWDQFKNITLKYPVQVSLDFHVPLNYGTIRRIKGKTIWKPAKEDYEPNWDADNQWIWNKLFCDVLQIKRIIPNDNVKYINTVGPITFVETSDLNDRKLIFKISTNL